MCVRVRLSFALLFQTQVPRSGGSRGSNSKTGSSTPWGVWLWKTASAAVAAAASAATAAASQPAAPDKTENGKGDGDDGSVRKAKGIAGRPLLANATAEKVIAKAGE